MFSQALPTRVGVGTIGAAQPCRLQVPQILAKHCLGTLSNWTGADSFALLERISRVMSQTERYRTVLHTFAFPAEGTWHLRHRLCWAFAVTRPRLQWESTRTLSPRPNSVFANCTFSATGLLQAASGVGTRPHRWASPWLWQLWMECPAARPVGVGASGSTGGCNTPGPRSVGSSRVWTASCKARCWKGRTNLQSFSSLQSQDAASLRPLADLFRGSLFVHVRYNHAP